MTTERAALAAESITAGYDGRVVSEGLSVTIPSGEITMIVGPNGCGKSTLLKSLARVQPVSAGRVVLDGGDIRSLPTRRIAQRLGLLPQTLIAPDGIRVAELVARGRFPHQGIARQWSTADEGAVIEALRLTGLSDLSDRRVDELSGGQRQRVWIAMVLAQQTPIVLLDEPTTYLDIAHQIDVLELCQDLNRTEGHTFAMVLHDLNHACRYGTHLIVLHDGRVVAAGPPSEVVDARLIEEVFGIEAVVFPDPVSGTPMLAPAAGQRARRELRARA